MCRDGARQKNWKDQLVVINLNKDINYLIFK